jgi:hypothetical protein
MPAVDVNYVAVLVAALVFMVVGFVWYAMPVFGKGWMKEVGLKEKDIKNGPGTGYLFAVLAALVQAFVLAHIVVYSGAATWVDGLVAGTWVGVGFVAMSIGVNYIFARRSLRLWLIDSGYFILSLALSGAVLTVLG